jgi:hypothetical protein
MDDQQMEEDILWSQMEGQTVTSQSRMTFSQWTAGKTAERWV